MGALLLANGCGRSGAENHSPLELGTLRGPGYLARDPSGSAGAEPTPTDGQPPVSVEGAGPSEPKEVYPGERAVLEVVERACGGCHSADADDPAGFLLSINGLRDAGWLLPGYGEASPLAVWLQYGYGGARPGHSRIDVQPGDYRAVVDFTDGMEVIHCSEPSPFGRDVAIEAMLRDLQARDPADRPFIRYIGIQHASVRARCGTYSVQDAALVELLNAVSLGPSVVLPPLIETAYTHAIDLRDYAWNRPIDLGWGTAAGTFPDAWEALVAMASPFAHELTGPEADALKLATGTSVPYVPAHVFVAVASTGDLYHSLVGLGTDISATRDTLGVVDTGLRRAGMFGAAGPPGDRVVVRRVQGGKPERSWWTREWVDVESDPGGLRSDPIGYPQSGSELMFELPNGFFAFAIAASDGSRVAQEPSCLGGVCDPPIAAASSVTCRACHGSGRLILPADEVRAFAEANPSAYDTTTLSIVRDQYRPDELGALLTRDMQGYDAALEQLEGSRYYNLIGMVYHAFWRPLDAGEAAGELGVTVDELRAAIPVVEPVGARLAPWLGEGRVEREVFQASFRELACTIGGSRNLPAGCP